MRYDDASNTGSMAADSAPTARPDVDFLPQGDPGPATGNTITGAGTTSGAAGADLVGDAPARIVEVNGAAGPAAASGNSFQANGQYGVLTMDAQGNFSYARNGGTPDGVQDVFGYTLADRDGSTSSTTLTVNIGRDLTLEAMGSAQGVVNLPPGVELSDIRVVGRDLVITMPDGTQMVIPGGAVFVPQLVIGDVEVPATNLAALLVNSEPQPAAGLVPSSGGNFAAPVPPLDPGVPLGDLIPPTELVFTPPEFEEPGQFLDRDPEIIIDPVDGAPSVNAVSDVDEAGLPGRAGPEPEGTGEEAAAGADGDPSETTTGVIDINSPDGIDGVTINGVLVTGVAGQTIAGDFGTLTVTGILPNGDIQYSYTLGDNTIGDATHDDFEVTVTDDDGDTATATLTINIIDDEPIARDDTDALAVGGTSTDGNVLTAVGTTNSGADTPGADGFNGETNDAIDGVTGIRPGTSGSFTAVAQNGTGVTVAGTFGTLTIHNDGSYTYTLTSEDREGGTDVFTYQITDGDGDVDTATLTITVPADPNAPPIAEGDSVNVSEEGLPNGLPDATGTPDTTDSATANGSISISDPDGDPLTVTLGTPSGSFTSGGAPINWVVTNGGHTLVGYTGGNPALNHVIEVTIANDGTYTVTLLNQFDHPDDTIEDGLSLTISVSVSDGELTTPTSIVVVVEDDSPEPRNNEGSVRGIVDEDNLPTGNNDVQPGDDDPGNADGDNDGTTTGGAAGSLTGLYDSGADEPLSIGLSSDTSGLPALTSGGVPVTYSVVGNVLTGSAGGSTVFTLTVNADGSWVFDLEGALDHASGNSENDLFIDFSSVINAEDFDGDPAGPLPNGSFVIHVDDDIPTPKTPVEGQPLVSGLVDEDNLPDGNNDVQAGDDDPGNADGDNDGTTTGGAAGSLGALFNAGADQPLTFSMNASTAGLPALTSAGVPVTYSVVGNVLTASAGGSTVFTFTINSNGSWVFDLQGQLDHPAGNNENNLSIDLSSMVHAVDQDGDPANAAAGALVVSVDDDLPVPANEGSVTGLVDEDDLPTGNHDNAPGDDDPGNADGDNDGTTVSGAAGSLASLYSVGADDPLSFGLSTDTSGLPALTSGGVPVTYSVVGNVLTASAGGSTVFTLTVNADGSWTFDLEGQLDHASGNSENNLLLDFSSIIEAEDFDHDPAAPLPAGSFVINVDDDIPTPKTPVEGQPLLGGLVDEDNLPTGNNDVQTGDDNPGNADGDNDGTTTGGNAGSLAALFNAGADQPLTFGMNASTAGLPALTSGGVPVTYSVVGNVLTASAGGNTVFTFTINADGSWVFDLQDQLDHPAGNNENNLAIDLSSMVQAVDQDGDPATAAAGALVISVDDDIPVPKNNEGSVTGLVDEDNLPTGIGDNATGDDDPGNADGDNDGTTTGAGAGSLNGLYNVGADEPLTIGLSNNTSGLPALTSGGVPVTYSVVGNVLTASAGAGNTVFILTVNANGSWTFNLEGQLDHALGNNENNLFLDFSSIITARDFDNDPAPPLPGGSFVINVDDDIPVARNDADEITGGGTTATGNVITGAGTTGGAAGADSPGADDPITVTAISGTGGTDTTFTAGLLSIGGAHGTLTMDAAGNYTYTRTDNLGGVNDVFTYTIRDADGDTTTATLTINIEDNVPTATPPAEIWLDDDTEAGGNAGGVGDRNPDTQNTVGFLTGTGGDGDLDFFLSASQTNLPSGFTAAFDGAAPAGQQWLIISQGGTPVIRVELVNETGAYTVTQLAQIDHALDGNTEGEIPLGNAIDDIRVMFFARDADGDDLPPANMTITVDDDTPINNGVTVSVTVHEDALNNADAVGNNEGGKTTTASITVAQLQSLVSPGADSPVTIGLNASIDGVNTGLTQNGTPIVWDFVSATQVRGLVGNNAADVAFTLTFDAVNNEWDFVLLDNIDNTPTAAGDADTDSLSLNGVFTATDSDGDIVVIDAGASVNIENDIPANNAGTVSVTVHEDALNNADAIGNNEGGKTVTASITVAQIQSLVSPGADSPVTIGLNAAIDGVATGLTQNGVSIVWDVVSATQVRGLVGNNAADVAFTLTFDAVNNEWDFVLLDNIDHDNDASLLTGEGDAFLETLSLANVFTARDTDGDTVVIDGGASINIENDVPVNFTPVDLTDTDGSTATTQDDALVNDGAAVATRLINDANNNGVGENFMGADGFGDLFFTGTAADNGQQLQSSGGTPLTSGGLPIYVFGYGTGVLTATTSATNSNPAAVVFTVTLNENAGFGATSTYTIDFNQTIDNGAGFVVDNFESAPAGQNQWIGLDTDGGDINADNNDSPDLLLTPTNAGGTINTSSTDIGNANQWIDQGEGIRVDYVTDVRRDGANDEKDAQGYLFDGHYVISGASFQIMQTQGGGDLAVRISAFNDPDTGNIKTLGGAVVPIDPSSIVITGDATYTIFNMGDGTFVITGLNAGANIAFDTGGADFNAISITSADGVLNPTTPAPADTFVGADFAVGVFGFFTADAGDPIDLSFDVTARDFDGDTSTGTIDVTLVPEPLNAFAALSANDNLEQQRSTNTMILAGALAAAGLATEPLAASPKDHKADSHEDRGGKSQNDSSLKVDANSVDQSNSGNLLDQSAAEGSAEATNEAGQWHDTAAAEDEGVSNEDAPAPAVSELAQGTDAPTQSEAQASQPMMADAVAMPSAEQLEAAKGEGKSTEGDDGKLVGKVLADALNGGEHGKDLDALINAVSGQDNGQDSLASHGGSAVSNGDMGDLAGLAAAHSDDIMTQMTMHQDAAPANG